MDNDTIAALATAPHPSGIAVIRLSGPEAKSILGKVFKPKSSGLLSERKLFFGEFVNPKDDSILDEILAVSMPGPKSYTGQDVVELHLHGNPLLAKQALRVLYESGARPAEAGEFTKRAFLNSKLDLTQAEAVSELISASSQDALKIAREHLDGKLSSAVDHIAEPLRDITAEIEAYIDFPEEDIAPDSLQLILKKLKAVEDKIKDLMATFEFGRILREGYRVLLCGCPNVGKSSLLNNLLGTERAIVTEVSGTTRDVIEEQCLINNHHFVFCDSAGITDTTNKVEKIGIELTKSRMAWADLILLVADVTRPETDWSKVLSEINIDNPKVWLIVNKCDLASESKPNWNAEDIVNTFFVSSLTNDGLDQLKNALALEVESQAQTDSGISQVITSERHFNCLVNAEARVRAADRTLSKSEPLEITSAELRSALSSLEEIVGKTYNEDILGRIFAKFCIGK